MKISMKMNRRAMWSGSSACLKSLDRRHGWPKRGNFPDTEKKQRERETRAERDSDSRRRKVSLSMRALVRNEAQHSRGASSINWLSSQRVRSLELLFLLRSERCGVARGWCEENENTRSYFVDLCFFEFIEFTFSNVSHLTLSSSFAFLPIHSALDGTMANNNHTMRPIYRD